MGKALRTALATVLLGGLLGYLVTGLGGPLIEKPEWTDRGHESALAAAAMTPPPAPTPPGPLRPPLDRR